MSSNPDVLALLEEILDSGRSPEEVCRSCPELLPEVRQRWRAFRRVDGALAAFFPDPATPPSTNVITAGSHPADVPQVPGYRVEALLGRGGMGVVYRAWHLRLNRAVALKMLLAGPCALPEELERFRREAEAVAGLRHPNIVQVYDVGDVDGRPYFTMELIEGGDLAEKIQGVPQPARPAAALVATLADAIHVAHQSGIVHRDLKPGNILLTADGTPKVTDFGLAWRLEGDGGLTLSGVPVGTPSYMAPCQARCDKRAIGPATDVYALGAILYELLTGRPPFCAETGMATLQQVVADEPVPPARLNPRVPRDLETICLKCLHKPPQRRYASAAALADDLRRFEKGKPITARPVGAAERAWKWVRRRPALAGMLVAVALLVCVGGVSGWQYYRQQVIAQERQAQIDEKVRGLLERARGLLDEGWPAADLNKVTQASALASRADDLARSDGASAALQQEAEAFRDHAAAQLQRLEQDRALLGALQDVLGMHEPVGYFDKTARGSLVLAAPNVDDEYARAFRRWGLDVDGTAEDVAAARLGAEPDAVVQEVIPALDGWMLLRLRDRPGADWGRLSRLAERLDGSGRRRQLRALVVSGAPRAAGVAGLVGLGSPWPALWELGPGSSWRSLLELRKEIDHRTEPIPTLVLFAYACADVGDLASAEEVLRQAAAARPQEVLLLAALANVQKRQGLSKSTEALGYYRAAYSRSRHQGLALGWALLQAGKPVEAEELLRELVRQPPYDRDARVPFYLGNALLGQKRYSEAEAAYGESLRLRPDWAAAFTNLGVALGLQAKYGPAEVACRKSIALEPDGPVAYMNLSFELDKQGKYEEAEAAARKAIALRPNSATAWSCLGTALYGQRKAGEAETAFRKAIAVEPGESRAHYNLGTALAAQRRHREAEAAFREAIALKFEDGEIHNNLGVSLMDQKNHGAAEAAFRKAITLKPDYGLAYRNLGYVLLRQARFDEAAAALRKVGDLLPASSPVRQHARQLEQQCGQYVALDARLPAILRGTEKPAGAVEQLHFAELCLRKKHHAAAASFYLAAFASKPELALDVPGPRYDAATAAALASCGQGKDAAQLDDKERARWRRQALAWLHQDLASWDRVLHQANARARVRIQQTMQYWQVDDDLAGLREPDALAKLPPDERQECLALWKEVAAVIGSAQSTK